MLLGVTLLFPFVLLALMLVMERVERPLRRESISDQVAGFLETARPDEIESFVRQGLAPALERYWGRRGVTRLLPRRTAAARHRRG